MTLVASRKDLWDPWRYRHQWNPRGLRFPSHRCRNRGARSDFPSGRLGEPPTGASATAPAARRRPLRVASTPPRPPRTSRPPRTPIKMPPWPSASRYQHGHRGHGELRHARRPRSPVPRGSRPWGEVTFGPGTPADLGEERGPFRPFRPFTRVRGQDGEHDHGRGPRHRHRRAHRHRRR